MNYELLKKLLAVAEANGITATELVREGVLDGAQVQRLYIRGQVAQLINETACSGREACRLLSQRTNISEHTLRRMAQGIAPKVNAPYK